MTKPINYQKHIDLFAESSAKGFDAALAGDWKENNKWVKKQIKAFQNIIEIGEPARLALLDLLTHENLAIAKSAAAYSLKYSTDASIKTLNRIAKEPGILGFEAQQTLARWKDGDWHLDEF